MENLLFIWFDLCAGIRNLRMFQAVGTGQCSTESGGGQSGGRGLGWRGKNHPAGAEAGTGQCEHPDAARHGVQ